MFTSKHIKYVYNCFTEIRDKRFWKIMIKFENVIFLTHLSNCLPIITQPL